MKKTLALLLLVAGSITVVSAQQKEKVLRNETKVKKTATVPQRVHNTFSKHKHHSGYKVKHVKKVENVSK